MKLNLKTKGRNEMKKFIWAAMLLPSLGVAQILPQGSFVEASAMRPVTATTIAVASATTVSTTAMNLATPQAYVGRLVCDVDVAYAIISGVTGTMVVSATGSGFRLPSLTIETPVVPASSTLAVRSVASAGTCNWGRLGR